MDLNIPMTTKAPMDLGSLTGMGQETNFNQQPQQGFTQPQQGFTQPQQNFAQPQQSFAQPQQNFAQPQPQQNFAQPQPQQSFAQPQQSFAQPQQNFAQTQQSFAQPQPQNNASSGGGVILKKGQKVDLAKLSASLDLVDVGLGWDLGPNGQAYDLDVEAFMLGENGRVLGDDWFVFYGSMVSPDGSVKTNGDNKTGAGAGDDEVVTVKLSQVNPQVQKIIFVVTINEAKEHGYNFSNVSNAYVRLIDKISSRELARFNLTDYYANVCSMMVGELYRHNGQWKFNPIGDGTADDLYGLCTRYGVNVAG